MKTDTPVNVHNIAFRYPGAERPAVDGVSLNIAPGELHLLVGENGAGKTTLAKILHGRLTADEGEFAIPQSLYLPQHLLSYPETSLEEYLWLYYSQGHRSLPRWTSGNQRRHILCERISSVLDGEPDRQMLHDDVASISSNLLHIYCAAVLLSRDDIRTFILDEPTAVLSETESRLFYHALSRVVSKGAAVLLITHRIAEALTHAQRITLMRRGLAVASYSRENFPPLEDIHRQMFVHPENKDSLPFFEDDQEPQNAATGVQGDPVFELHSLSRDFADLCSLRDINIRIKAGEILSVCGIRDEGLEQLERLLSGRADDYRGRCFLNGEEIDLGDIRNLRRRNCGIVPSQRKTRGVALGAKAWENIGIYLRGVNLMTSRSISPRRRFKELVLSRFADVGLDLEAGASQYSGGMLQRLIVQREIRPSDSTAAIPPLLIIASPGWGLDPLQRREIYRLIRQKAREGSAVLIISTELDEALILGSRIAFVNNGEIFYPQPELYTDKGIMEACFLGRWQGIGNA